MNFRAETRSPRPGAKTTVVGGTMPVSTLAEVAHAWFGDRLAPDWRPRSSEENQAILSDAGLTGGFWRLT